MAIEMIEEFDQGTQIKVIGVGGGGGNAVDHMIAQCVQGVEFICANTDAQALNRSSAHQLIQLGTTGLGAGAKPEVGRSAAVEAEERIREAITGANMLFITAGMGGGTGTGAAPIIARVAKEMGILTVGVVTKPFDFEGIRRTKAADAGLAELEANVDSLIVVLNDKLLDVLGDDVTQDQAFAHANDVLKNAVGGISDIIHMPGLVNVDFEDVKTVMSEPGKAMMGTASAGGPDRANQGGRPGGGLPAARGHRPFGCARRAGADSGQPRQLQARREPQRDEHDPPLRRRGRARDLRHRLRREPGRPVARDGDRHRPVVAGAARADADERRAQRAAAAHRHRQLAGHGPAGACRTGNGAAPAHDYSDLSRRASGATAAARRPRSMRWPATAWTRSRSRRSCASRRTELVARPDEGLGGTLPNLGCTLDSGFIQWTHAAATHPEVPDPRRRRGLHSGQRVELTLRPAPPDSGIVFRRVDLPEPVDIAVSASVVSDTRMASTISAGGDPGAPKVQTIEHLLSACAGSAWTTWSSTSPPTRCPSSTARRRPSCSCCKAPASHCRTHRSASCACCSPVEVREGEGAALKWARLDPFEGYKLTFEIEFDHPAVDQTGQRVEFDMGSGQLQARYRACAHLRLHEGRGDDALARPRRWVAAWTT